MSDALIDVLLAFADDEHLMGQQHTEWIGVAPFLEEDLAFSSIGQDELGHAVLLYEHVLELQGSPTGDLEIDTLAYRRSADDYRSSAFTEYVTTDWAEALVRHWIYDTVEVRRWSFFEGSSDQSLQDTAAAALREEVYHRRHADALLDSLLQDPEARPRLIVALDDILALVPSLLTPADGELAALAAGLITGSVADLATEIEAAIEQRFEHAISPIEVTSSGRSQRSDHYGPLMQRMREVLDYDPNAVW